MQCFVKENANPITWDLQKSPHSPSSSSRFNEKHRKPAMITRWMQDPSAAVPCCHPVPLAGLTPQAPSTGQTPTRSLGTRVPHQDRPPVMVFKCSAPSRQQEKTSGRHRQAQPVRTAGTSQGTEQRCRELSPAATQQGRQRCPGLSPRHDHAELRRGGRSACPIPGARSGSGWHGQPGRERVGRVTRGQTPAAMSTGNCWKSRDESRAPVPKGYSIYSVKAWLGSTAD